MIVYPLITAALNLSDTDAGILIGGTIHDVAQEVGAGYIISNDVGDVGDVSTMVKLLRVAMLVPAVMVFIYLFRNSRKATDNEKVPALPSFLVAFSVLINSMGWIPPVATEVFTKMSGWCLVTAIAALGIKTSFKKLAIVG
jgi:uncharacterized membrane protein YadS